MAETRQAERGGSPARRAFGPGPRRVLPGPAGVIGGLQRSVGNQAVQRLLVQRDDAPGGQQKPQGADEEVVHPRTGQVGYAFDLTKNPLPDGWVMVRGLVRGPSTRVAAFPPA
jgi:hypothetical protein